MTDRGERHREIEKRNQEIDTITAEVAAAIERGKIAALSTRTGSIEPVKSNQTVAESEKKPWWKRATDFVFGSASKSIHKKAEKQTQQSFESNIERRSTVGEQLQYPKPLQKIPKKQAQSAFERLSARQSFSSDRLQYPQPNQTQSQKKELAIALVKQIGWQRSRCLFSNGEILVGKKNQSTESFIYKGL